MRGRAWAMGGAGCVAAVAALVAWAASGGPPAGGPIESVGTPLTRAGGLFPGRPVWMDGERLLAYRDGRLSALNVRTGASEALAPALGERLRGAVHGGLALSPSGNWFGVVSAHAPVGFSLVGLDGRVAASWPARSRMPLDFSSVSADGRFLVGPAGDPPLGVAVYEVGAEEARIIGIGDAPVRRTSVVALPNGRALWLNRRTRATELCFTEASLTGDENARTFTIAAPGAMGEDHPKEPPQVEWAVSPRGDRLAFLAWTDGDPGWIERERYQLANGHPMELVPVPWMWVAPLRDGPAWRLRVSLGAEGGADLHWLPDGKRVGVCQGEQLWIVPAE